MEPLNPQTARIRIQIEYIAMPGLKLTLAQVGRLFNLPQDASEAAISALVESGFLSRAGDGSFLRHGLGRHADAIIGPRSVSTAF